MKRPATAFRVSLVRSISGALAVLVIAGAACLAAAIPGSSDVSHPALSGAARRGETIFRQHCVLCHDKRPGDTSPFGPPNLHGIFRASAPMRITPRQAVATISDGKGNMPAFGKTLSRSQIQSLISYLKTQ